MIIALALLVGILIGVGVYQAQKIRKLKNGIDKNFLNQLGEKYRNLEKDYEQNYRKSQDEIEQRVMRDLDAKRLSAVEELQTVLNECEEKKAAAIADKQTIADELEDFKKQRAAINEAIAREREKNEKLDFYRIQISEDDIYDMKMMKEIAPQLRHRDLLPKLMWDAIVSRPYQEMVKRVLGAKSSSISGIYKITYIPTGESYVGQSSDIKTRWANHLKTALGMDKAASSTLHTHMAQHGVENYTFELLEECPNSKLREREKFYIDTFGTKNQLNQRLG